MPNFWKTVNSVIDSSDIVLMVLDARFVGETRNRELENKVMSKGKKLLFVVNKCDLADKKRLGSLKRELVPSVFVSSRDRLGTSILKKKLLELAGKEEIVAGVVGYPNTGKSSVINALSGRRKARTSAQSGFTRGVQAVRAGPRIRLLDTPGVIPYREDDAYKHALIGSVDAARVKDPESAALRLIDSYPETVRRHYSLDQHCRADSADLLDALAVKKKRLRKGGEPDTEAVSRLLLSDWQKGKIKS